jgi:hypothetical protein
MTSKNEITGDKLQTKPTTQKYRDGWDAIFGKAEEQMKKPIFNNDEHCCGKCSPCSGYHKDDSFD